MARMRTSLKTLRRQQKQKEQQGEYRLKKYAAVGIALAITVGTWWYFSSHPPRSPIRIIQQDNRQEAITLNDARRHPEKRQRFLDTLLQGYSILGCEGVVYDHEGDKIISYLEKGANLAEQRYGKTTEQRQYIGGQLETFRGGTYDIKTPDVLEFSGEGRVVPIFVGRRIFEGREFSYLTENDLRAIIVVHEGEHVRQHQKGFSYLSKNEIFNALEKAELTQRVLYDAYEFDAYIHEVPRLLSENWNVSWYHLNESKARFLATSLSLVKAGRDGSLLQQKLVENLQAATAKRPLIRDVSIDPRWFKEYRRLNPQKELPE